ncbi:TPA: DUF2357 domain-containing protein [Pyrococcus horikoshii]|uniref:DUF2357 domain-containing protein n=1 Tax=Pyrococcus horikoshii TaxID=53953 RepID=A0A832T4H7_PYRHR|nr:DUF2357 domain-containing protein [Pyrococcus horikoshii]
MGKEKFKIRIGNQDVKVERYGDLHVARFSFKNYIGKTKIEILTKDKTIVLEGEVLSKKVPRIYGIKEDNLETIIKAHRKFYEALVKELWKISSTLPFSVNAPTSFGTVESNRPMNELFAYYYLRSNRERILGAFETLMKFIKRKLVVKEELVDVWEADDVNPDAILWMTQHPEYLTPGRKFSPTKVLAFRKYESFDTPENRFAKYFLDLLIEWGERAQRNVGGVRDIIEDLRFLRSDPLWEEVGKMKIFPYTSQTLLKGEGYRELLGLYQEFVVRMPFFAKLREAIDNRDIARLYEYWVFFKLVKELEKILGEKNVRITIEPARGLSEEGNVYAEFKGKWRLYYNRKLRPRKFSYSVSLKPDFSLFREGKVVGVFDAKFKLELVDVDRFADEDKEMEENPSIETWAKLEDIYKMHTYRDALRCKFAVVLYPGSKSVFFDAKRGKIDGVSLAEIIGKEGIGYLSFIPGGEEDEY